MNIISNSLVVVVPVFNEESNIDLFFQRLEKGTQGFLKGVVIVDDGSTDQTVSHIMKYVHEYSVPVRLIRLSRNFGHQTALVAGCEHGCLLASELGAEWIGVIDGDLQDRPEDFPALLEHASDYDVVYAVRAQRYDGWIMKTFAPRFYTLLSKTSTFPIPQNAGTFSIIRVPVCRHMVENADSDPYFPGLRAWAGFRQKGLLLDRQARASGSSKVAIHGLIRLSLRALILHSDMPMRLIFMCTGILFAVLILLATIITVLRIYGIILPSGVTTIMLLQIFSLGISACLFSIISLMLNRIKSNTSRPRSWIIMEIRESDPSKTQSIE